MGGAKVHGWGEQMPAVVAVARARSLRGQRPARRLETRVRRRVRELVPLVVAARARDEVGRGASAAREAVEKAEEARRCTRVAQAAAGPRRGRMEKAAGSGRRQTETRGVAEEGKSEHEGGRRGDVSTIGEGASARSAEGGASASPIGQDASARSAGEGASHLPARLAKERVQGVRRGEHLPAQSEKEPMQGVQRGGHLPARSAKEQVQDVQSRQRLVDAAGSRGAPISIHISFATLSEQFTSSLI